MKTTAARYPMVGRVLGTFSERVTVSQHSVVKVDTGYIVRLLRLYDTGQLKLRTSRK
ncbi:hypothetical protein [Gordonia rhizosphera]|uniref:Uncharacterized protein n=1 Tax=Gordonia rhizosphera NBRC 16068 TaxID=1108045 RepID=K6VMS1_9ACTN|nr:hypothetical protein [Gordonia rhizosphera]GAB88200.1 hypothetical protein GORHZ_009_00150 [Gordonia rhizosphera NBRC 16068]